MHKVPTSLRITEIFYSLQGESTTVGLPTVFVRLTGCPLRCQYCDTAYAFHGGDKRDLDLIVQQVLEYNCKHVCVTGGEPLAQPSCIELLKRLCDLDLMVSLETSGARSLEHVDPRVMIVMDLKTPDSGEVNKNMWSNLDYLKPTDQVKFVLCSQNDYQWACDVLRQYQLNEKAQILFSSSWGQLNPTTLADWIVKDRLPVRFQMQLHKILWNDAPGH
jgi:7-carboxy-7-deazaguanine synthase